MKRIVSLMCGFALFSTLCLSAGAQVVDKAKDAGGKTVETTKKVGEKTAATTKSAAQKAKDTIVPKTDGEIQKCITDGLAASAKLKDLGLSATVDNGETTLIGQAKSSGNKNAASSIAKNCGAKKVVNNITIPGPPPPKPAEEKKSEPAKKP
jgi:osmotically-inducible protein OsmY